MRAEDLLEHTLAGYRLLEILGRGGMGIVFLAQPVENPDDRVAIKILMPPDIATAGEFASFKARFQREARAAYQLKHEHILSVLAYGEEDGLCYMVMPMLTGGTLAERIASTSEVLPLDEIARYIKQLAHAIDYAHQHGLVHRDIKPSNVLLDGADNAYLADFGIVHLFDSGQQAFDQELTTLTTVGKIYGTPAYMAPERYKGEPAEPTTDIYALGILLYQLVTGQVPFDADNPLALGMKHLNEVPVAPHLLRPSLPEPAEAAILKAIAKNPLDRFPTASALADAFETGLGGMWAKGLPPVPEILAAQTAEVADATVKRPVAAGAALVEEPRQAPLILPRGAEVPPGNPLPLELAPTVVDTPALVPSPARPRRRGRIVALAMLGAALCLAAGLLAFAASKFIYPVTPAPTPALHSVSTDTGASTSTKGTAVSTAGSVPATRSTSTTPTVSASRTPATTPTARSTPTAAPPTPTRPPATPVPTSPPATPTAQGTP